MKELRATGLVVTQQGRGSFVWDAQDAWGHAVEVAVQADRLGFETIWLFDHLNTRLEAKDDMLFESFTSLSALATLTHHVRIGHAVACTAWRNPAITTEMIATMDVISGGRMILGVGAGWKPDEWEAYGSRFPPARGRLAILGDYLQVRSSGCS